MTDQLALVLPPPLDWRALRVVLGSRHLNTTEKLVIMRVWSFDGAKRGRHRGCYASVSYMADELGLSERAVKAVFAELTYLGLLVSKAHGRGRLRVITVPAEAQPRSDDTDDMVRARHIFDAIVMQHRNDLDAQRRDQKPGRVHRRAPQECTVVHPSKRDSLGRERPTPLPRGTARTRSEPVSLDSLLRKLREDDE